MQVSPSIEKLAQAIAKAEGFGVPDAIPTKAHNPGDLIMPGWTGESLGEGISVFESDEVGWNHLYHQLVLIAINGSHVYTLDMTIEQMASKWTATQQEAWAQNVARELGVSIYTTLREGLVNESLSASD